MNAANRQLTNKDDPGTEMDQEKGGKGKGTDREQEEQEEQEQGLDIVINNVVSSFTVRCHLNLRDIALRGVNVEYRKENGVRRGGKCNTRGH